jgi:hypothetical protein
VPHPTTPVIVSYFVLVAVGVLVHIIDWVRRPAATGKLSTTGKSGWQRFLDFIEQPLFLVVVSIIGGIVGVLVYTPVFLVCDVCVLLALHRSQAVADKGTKTQVFWYLLLLLITSSVLVGVGISLRKGGRNFVHELARAVAEATKPTMEQPMRAQSQVQPQAPENPPRPQVPLPIPLKAYDVSGRRGEVLLTLLSAQLEPRDTIRVGCISWIEDSCIAAGRFLLLFSQAGWKIDSNRVFRFDPSIPREGMTMAAKTPKYTDNLPPHLGHWGRMDTSQVTFWLTFSWLQIPVDASGDPDMPEGTIGIYFGSEPKNVTVRTAAQAQAQLAEHLGMIVPELRAVKLSCPAQVDTCNARRLQWTQVVSVFLDDCDCGLSKTWSKKWKAASDDAGTDPVTIIDRQKEVLQQFIVALKKAKH